MFAVSDLAAHLVGGLAGGLGILALAQVVMGAAEQGGEPSGDDQQFAVLVEGDPAGQKPGHLSEALWCAVAQRRGGNNRVGAAQQIDGLGEGFESAGSDVGGLELLGEFHRAVQLGLGPQRINWHNVCLDEAAIATASLCGRKAEIFGL